MVGPRPASALRIAAISGLLTVGYFCHLVSLGLTVVGLVVLSGGEPGHERCRKPLAMPAGTAGAHVDQLFPLVVLGFLLPAVARRGGPMQPVWGNLSNPWSPAAWRARLGWVDPVTLAIKDGLPFTERVGPVFTRVCSGALAAVAMVLWWYGRISADPRASANLPDSVPVDQLKAAANAAIGSPGGRQAWLVLAALLLVGGTVGPDSFGASTRRIPAAACGPFGLGRARCRL